MVYETKENENFLMEREIYGESNITASPTFYSNFT